MQALLGKRQRARSTDRPAWVAKALSWMRQDYERSSRQRVGSRGDR